VCIGGGEWEEVVRLPAKYDPDTHKHMTTDRIVEIAYDLHNAGIPKNKIRFYDTGKTTLQEYSRSSFEIK